MILIEGMMMVAAVPAYSKLVFVEMELCKRCSASSASLLSIIQRLSTCVTTVDSYLQLVEMALSMLEKSVMINLISVEVTVDLHVVEMASLIPTSSVMTATALMGMAVIGTVQLKTVN